MPDSKDEVHAFFATVCDQPACRKMPFQMYMLDITRLGLFETWLQGDVARNAELLYTQPAKLVKNVEGFEDPATIELVDLVCAGFEFVLVSSALFYQDFDWDEVPLEQVERGMVKYNYDVHHADLKAGNQDFCGWAPMGAVLGLHRGALQLFWTSMLQHKDNCIRLMREPDQKAERLAYHLHAFDSNVRVYGILIDTCTLYYQLSDCNSPPQEMPDFHRLLYGAGTWFYHGVTHVQWLLFLIV